jgi:hypothetical protein
MGKNQDPGSGIIIPDPQHWVLDFHFDADSVLNFHFDPDLSIHFDADPDPAYTAPY